MLTELDVLFRVNLAIVCGFLIGLERQINGHIVGIKTNILISLGSCIFVIFTFLVPTSDSTRIAAQVVTGVGFLCSSVIMRNGMSLNGLNTSATIWCTSAVGVLCSLGLWKISLIITTSLILSNIIFYYISDKIPSFKKYIEENDGNIYKITIYCKSNDFINLRKNIIKEIENFNFILVGVELKQDEENENLSLFKISLNQIGKQNTNDIEILLDVLFNYKEISNINWKLV